MEKVYVPKNPHEKAMQRALIQYRNPKNYELVVEALQKAGRTDLIGFDKNCLIRPRNNDRYGQNNQNGQNGQGRAKGMVSGKNTVSGKGAKGGSNGNSIGKPKKKKPFVMFIKQRSN